MPALTTSQVIQDQIPSTTGDGRFLRLEDHAPGDPQEESEQLTIGKAAEILSGIFGKGTCGGYDAPDAYSPELTTGQTPAGNVADYLQQKYIGQPGAQELAGEFGVGELCSPDVVLGGKIKKEVFVHASDDEIFDDYDLVSYDAAKSGPSIRSADIYVKLSFSNVAEIPIYYWVDQERLSRYLQHHALYGDIYEWRGSVKDAEGDYHESVEFNFSGGKIHLHGYYSGILVIRRLPIKFHLWTLQVNGVYVGDGKRDYSALVSAKTPYISDAVHLELSDTTVVDENATKCPSWGDPTVKEVSVIGGDGEEEGEEEGEGEGEGEEEGEGEGEGCDDPITAEEYLDKCCVAAEGDCIPVCRTIKSVYGGGIQVEGGQQRLIDKYGENTVFIPVSTKTGVCGERTDSFVDPSEEDCCDSITALQYWSDNPDVIGDFDRVIVHFIDGMPPLQVTVSGDGFFLDAELTKTEIVTNGRSVTIYTGNCCGTCSVTATDECSGQATGDIRGIDGKWVLVDIWGTFDGIGGQFAECVVGKNKYYEDYCGRIDGCPGTCSGDTDMFCEHPPYPMGDICTANGRKTYEWQC